MPLAILMLLANCVGTTEINPCDQFQYVTPSHQDQLTDFTERQILTNNAVLEEVCKKALPADTIQPSWIQRHFSVSGSNIFVVDASKTSYGEVIFTAEF